MKLSKKESRRLILQAAGLNQRNPFGNGKNAVYRTIDHLGYVQIDTISVVERAHHHILATRVSGYQNQWLEKLQADKKVLEYWSHAAAYLPMEDYRYTLPIKKYFAEQRDRWPKSDKQLMQKVYDRVKEDGPLMARDFEGDRIRKSEGWWDWKPAKLALERLFFQGSLVTVGRSGFQKIYDIPENVIPIHINTSEPTQEEYAVYLVERYIKSLGLATIGEITYLRKDIKPVVQKVIKEKVDNGQLIRIKVEGLENLDYYADKSFSEFSGRLTNQVHILSPFDNLTIQRNRLLNFFNYDYQIECYVPQSKRKYGYFCLPLLYGDQFVGRMDAKADRSEGRLIVRNLHFEGSYYNKISPDKFQKAIKSYAIFNGCEDIVFQRSNDIKFLNEIF